MLLIFQLVDVKITKKTVKGLNVELLPSKFSAFIPRSHLSDTAATCDLLHDFYKDGDVIKDSMYTGTSNIIVSFKVT